MFRWQWVVSIAGGIAIIWKEQERACGGQPQALSLPSDRNPFWAATSASTLDGFILVRQLIKAVRF